MTIEEKRQKVMENLASDESIEKAYSEMFGEEEQMKAFTKKDIMDASAWAAAQQIKENPAKILLVDEFAYTGALMTTFLFDLDEEHKKKGE